MNENKDSGFFQRYQFDKYLSTRQKDIDIQALPRIEMSRNVIFDKLKPKLRRLLEDTEKS